MESLIKLYNALCEGLLRYSFPALEPLTKTNSRLLEGLQAKVLRVCLGLPKNTSTLGTLRESRRLSPTVLCQQELLRARLRFVTRTVDHPLACDSEAEVRDLLPAEYQSSPEHTQPPWTFASWKITLTVPGIQSKAKLPLPALKFFSLEHIATTYQNYTHIFTDGSVMDTSSAIGMWIPSTRTKITAKLGHKTSSMVTELTALRAALEHILTAPVQAWAIFTDSRAALQHLMVLPQEQLAQEINGLHTQAINNHHVVVLQWLPSHCGVSGNDEADKAAASAHFSPIITPVPFTRRDGATLASSLAKSSQRLLWTDPNNTYDPLRTIDPECRFRMPTGLCKRDEAVLH